ncbi:MAG TPA: hypothetical protein VNC50_05275, partial [Planctomycetia bacterium]|nr:hypothetical protein [Planctomycetia bacterium]
MLVALLAVFAGLEERATSPHLLAADTKVALILTDPFPWLDGALGSERLKEFAGNMPKRGGAVDFEEMRAALAEKREFIPVEIGAGADAEGTASIGKLARFAIAHGIDDLEDEDEVVLRRKRAALADWRVALRELRMPGISLYARFRAEATATGIFTLAKTTLPGLAAEAGKWKAEGDALTLKVSLESFREFGADLFLPGDDANAQKAVGALFSAPLELRLQRNKDALRLTFGPPGKKSGWKPTGATWRDGRFAA